MVPNVLIWGVFGHFQVLGVKHVSDPEYKGLNPISFMIALVGVSPPRSKRWHPNISDDFNGTALEGVTGGVLGRKWLFKQENESLWCANLYLLLVLSSPWLYARLVSVLA